MRSPPACPGARAAAALPAPALCMPARAWQARCGSACSEGLPVGCGVRNVRCNPQRRAEEAGCKRCGMQLVSPK